MSTATGFINRVFTGMLVSYAVVPVSFQRLYGLRRPSIPFTLAIAFAMSGILVINILSVLLLVSLNHRDWLPDTDSIGLPEASGVFGGLLVAELLFVIFVQRKMARDVRFAHRVRGVRPIASICYTVVSVTLLIVSVVLVS